MHTHLEQWSAGTAAPGEQLGVQWLAQGSQFSPGQFLPEPRFKPTTSDYKSNALSTRPWLTPVLCIVHILSAYVLGAVGSHVTAPGEQLWVRCLAQGHLSRGIECCRPETRTPTDTSPSMRCYNNSVFGFLWTTNIGGQNEASWNTEAVEANLSRLRNISTPVSTVTPSGHFQVLLWNSVDKETVCIPIT